MGRAFETVVRDRDRCDRTKYDPIRYAAPAMYRANRPHRVHFSVTWDFGGGGMRVGSRSIGPEQDGQLRGEPLRSLAIRCSACAGLYVFGRGLRMNASKESVRARPDDPAHRLSLKSNRSWRVPRPAGPPSERPRPPGLRAGAARGSVYSRLWKTFRAPQGGKSGGLPGRVATRPRKMTTNAEASVWGPNAVLRRHLVGDWEGRSRPAPTRGEFACLRPLLSEPTSAGCRATSFRPD
jgi:hypothetical protein